MNKFDNLHDCFQSELQSITYDGMDVNSNDSKQTELLFRSVGIRDPRKLSIDHPSRKFNPAYSVLELFRTRHTLENFNKKGLYVLIREMTGQNTSKITKVVNVLKKQYVKSLKTFNEKGSMLEMIR